MLSHVNSDIPIVFISNTGESFYQYVGRADGERSRHELVREMQTIGDRALLYLGGQKLAITSAPVHHLEYLQAHLQYSQTQHAYPQQVSPCLSLDITNDPRLLQRIADFADTQKSIQLIPHASTPEFLKLVDCLTSELGLSVHLPETPSRESVWIRDYIDSKVGFRAFASRSLARDSHLILEGFTCQTSLEASRAAWWFLKSDRACVIKANRGNDALGIDIVKPGDFHSIYAIRSSLERNPFLEDDLIVVEAYAPSTQNLIPSAEFFVPQHHAGEPQFTYICNQIFMKGGTFSGILVDPDFAKEPWYEQLKSAGLQIARELQQSGYVGHFDLDAIVDDDRNLHLLEVNARRTGGTHIHELATHLFGEHYDRAFVSNTAFPCSTEISTFSALVDCLSDVLYPANDEGEGIVITHTSDLHEHRFGYVAIASSSDRVLELQQMLAKCVN